MKKNILTAITGAALFAGGFFVADALTSEKTEEKLLQQYYEVEGGSIYTDYVGDTYFVRGQDIEWLLVEVNKDKEVLKIK